MASAVDRLMIDDGPSVDWDEDFRWVMEDHLTYLKNHSQTKVIPVDAGKAYQYEFDLHGYLYNVCGYPLYMHWIIMRCSGLKSITDFNSKVPFLIAPSADVVSQIRQTHLTTHRVN